LIGVHILTNKFSSVLEPATANVLFLSGPVEVDAGGEGEFWKEMEKSHDQKVTAGVESKGT